MMMRIKGLSDNNFYNVNRLTEMGGMDKLVVRVFYALLINQNRSILT